MFVIGQPLPRLGQAGRIDFKVLTELDLDVFRPDGIAIKTTSSQRSNRPFNVEPIAQQAPAANQTNRQDGDRDGATGD
jgi:hypothetical protein